ncbi:hypothetical protein [Pseudomonas sp. Irchel 3F5]|uniref:hypothetical protein n=1 Tax=Pseudomonas sp. Irchel 3F5 TaxID=2009002 RepID=UPI000BA3B7A1|nr:hypothetical protein [Pseudomonas sp. Irchel 3F5]
MKSIPAKQILLAFALTSPFASMAMADIGPHTAAAMQAAYEDTRPDCDGEAAYACSGIMLRVTTPSDHYYTWNNSPKAVEKRGVSFSYLRADAPISALAESARSGYTLAPTKRRPAGTMKYNPICAYPTDGDSWERDKGGCGNNKRTPQVKENLCNKLGIHTAEQWISHYRASSDPEVIDRWAGNPDYRYAAQCAFDIRENTGAQGAQNFYQALRVMQLMEDRPFAWNEIMVLTWDEARFKELPIQSFFYIEGTYGGLEDAQRVQRDWHRTTDKFVPVIQISLPLDEQPARFLFNPGDQVIRADQVRPA